MWGIVLNIGSSRRLKSCGLAMMVEKDGIVESGVVLYYLLLQAISFNPQNRSLTVGRNERTVQNNTRFSHCAYFQGVRTQSSPEQSLHHGCPLESPAEGGQQSLCLYHDPDQL